MLPSPCRSLNTEPVYRVGSAFADAMYAGLEA